MPSPALELDDAPLATADVSPLNPLWAILKPLASLQLTVVLFALSLILVFFGTLAQKNAGVWTVVDQYFWSMIVRIDTQLVFQFLQIFCDLSPSVGFSWKVPFPGGMLLGGLMFVNLIAAHILRFKLTWRRAGIFIIHGGILLLFVGEFIAREYTIEQKMPIMEGESANYSMDSRNYELAVVLPKGSVDRTVVVPVSKLKSGTRIDLPEMPFDFKVLDYFPNTDVDDIPSDKPGASNTPAATHGFGRTISVKSIPPVSGVETDDQKADIPSARVEIVPKGSDTVLATYFLPLFWKVQEFKHDGKTYELSMRNTRYYKPYSINLNKFRYERYVGTNIPKNFQSDITLKDPEENVETSRSISMNAPMRYRGETFYQSGVLPGEKGTILAVVRNPGYLLPYASCVIVTLGLLLHFGMHLNEYLQRLLSKRSKTEPIALSRGQSRLAWIVLSVVVLLTILAAMPHGTRGQKDLDLARIARLPVYEGGRIKPLDSAARVTLRQLNHKEFYLDPKSGKSRPAIDWWLSAASVGEDASESVAFQAAVFRVENDQILDLAGLPRRDGLRYSAKEIQPKFKEIVEGVKKAKAKDKNVRDLYDVKLLEFFEKLTSHSRVMSNEAALAIAPADGGEWQSYGAMTNEGNPANFEKALQILNKKSGVNFNREQYAAAYQQMDDAAKKKFNRVLQESIDEAINSDPAVVAWAKLYTAYKAGDQVKLDEATTFLEDWSHTRMTFWQKWRVRIEGMLNDSAPYFWCIGLYLLAFLLTAISWTGYTISLGAGEAWRNAAVKVLLFTFAIHTFTLLARMFLLDRPFVFVTNLYSTAVFIGWAAVGIALLVERFIPITLGCATASILGFLTTILAHNILDSGDNLEMLRAVLDTNFWLATHVTTINLGYSATYIAGLIGIFYLAVGILTPHLHKPVAVNGAVQPLGRLIGQILYGMIAGATVLSFVGTVLGGIWGDQSWGRFWGWDPKENGALMIVIWNTLILHARWAGLVKDRGIAVLALGGNIITTWSYFGTNQLGVGLHAYGFSNDLVAVCNIMWIVNFILIAIGLIPQRYWRSQKHV